MHSITQVFGELQHETETVKEYKGRPLLAVFKSNRICNISLLPN